MNVENRNLRQELVRQEIEVKKKVVWKRTRASFDASQQRLGESEEVVMEFEPLLEQKVRRTTEESKWPQPFKGFSGLGLSYVRISHLWGGLWCTRVYFLSSLGSNPAAGTAFIRLSAEIVSL